MPGPRLNAAFYADSVDAFLRASDDEVYAPLASPHGYTLAPEQLSAWRLQLPVLRVALADEKGDSHEWHEVKALVFGLKGLASTRRVVWS